MMNVAAGSSSAPHLDSTAEPLTRTTQIVEVPSARNTFSCATFQLVLDLDEQRLFESLTRTVDAYLQGTIGSSSGIPIPERKPVVIRVAGGWVRDKILGFSTHDVDVALDTLTGVQMATLLREYVTSTDPSQCGSIGVIAANPDQSKHLETATMKVHGIEVDFNNLRHETYAEDSRIPETVIGTPLEDSFRRDFTMNALYFNLNTRQIEDWTRRGLQDLLETKLVVTPLNAHETFHDDPLRVLRAIRFAVRFRMQLSPQLQEACRDPHIHHELNRKVSRERVGKELEGMISGKHADPHQAFLLICDLNLASSVFRLPVHAEQPMFGFIGTENLKPIPYSESLEANAWTEARLCLEQLPAILDALQKANSGFTHVDIRMVYLATILLPFKSVQYMEKKKEKGVAEFVVRESIKFKNKDAQGICASMQHLDDMVQLLRQEPEPNQACRLEAGLLLRQYKELWVTALAVAAVTLTRETGDMNSWTTRATQWFSLITTNLALDGCWNVRPLLNGKELMQALELPKGPEVGVYNQEQIRWMLMNPNGSIEQCKEHLKLFRKHLEEDKEASSEHIRKKMHL